MSRRKLLLAKSQSLATAIALKSDPEIIMSHFSQSFTVFAHEYAPPTINDSIPFLGTTFDGYEGIQKYMTLLGEYLEYEDMEFFDHAVAEEEEVVTVKGKAKWTYLKTGKKWEETFIWRLSHFDEEGKIGGYEVWADPLSLWWAAQEDTE